MSSIQDLTKEAESLVHASLRGKILPALFAASLGLVLLYAADFLRNLDVTQRYS